MSQTPEQQLDPGTIVGDPLATVIAFDFGTKQAPSIPVSEAGAAMARGAYVWIDVDLSRQEEARALVAGLGLCAPEILEDALTRDDAIQLARYDDYLHLVLTDLSSRKSAFVSETTQPFLANMVGTVERVLQDVLVDREILSDSLNSYMSMVAHRTNKVMGKLTVVSVIFLPLTFLCGVYGMNFEVLPELKWEWGYAGFWGLAAAIVAGLLLFMRRIRLL